MRSESIAGSEAISTVQNSEAQVCIQSWVSFVESGALTNGILLNILFSSSVDHLTLAPPITEPGISSFIARHRKYIGHIHKLSTRLGFLEGSVALPRRNEGAKAG